MSQWNDQLLSELSVSVAPDLRDLTYTFRGTVVSMLGSELVMVNNVGWEHTLTVAPDVEVTCDGVVCARQDLHPGERIQVTMLRSDRSVVTCIHSFQECKEFT